MKHGAGKRKGSKFERLMCLKLSLWWTEGERDDVFFRTASSGGRATQRSKKRQATFGQYGDIQATDPVGQPLLDTCTIECKDGYASDSIADLLDKQHRHCPKYEIFIKQADQASTQAKKGGYWMLIARRRGRQIMVYLPKTFYNFLRLTGKAPLEECLPRAILFTPTEDIVCIPFSSFLKHTSPKAFSL